MGMVGISQSSKVAITQHWRLLCLYWETESRWGAATEGQQEIFIQWDICLIVLQEADFIIFNNK